MMRLRSLWGFIGLLGMLGLACNAFAGSGGLEPEAGLTLPPPVVAETPTAEGVSGLAATATLAGTAVVGTPAPNTGEPLVTALVDLNVRSGPGVIYDRVSFLLKGESAPVIGQDPNTGWWKIVCPPRAGGSVAECWVSGGTQYTQAINVAGVPVAVAPPTPTPVPTQTPTPEAQSDVVAELSGLLAYVGDGRLFIAPLNLTTDPVTIGSPQLITTNGFVNRIYLSPNGRQIAYVSVSDETEILRVVNADGSNDQQLLQTTNIPVVVPDGMRLTFKQIAWHPDGNSLFFTTEMVSDEGPGSQLPLDFWQLTLDGTLTPVLPAGQGGVNFAIIGNQVILSHPRGVLRANLDGSGRTELIAFPLVNTASEWFFIPELQVTEDKTAVYTAIPDAEPLTPESTTALWRIPTTGDPEPLATIPSGIIGLFGGLTWSPGGTNLAFTDPQDEDGSSLKLASGTGEGVSVYAVADNLTFLGWSPDERHFLYRVATGFVVGTMGGDPLEVPLPGGRTVLNARWLTPTSYILVSGISGAWDLQSGNVAGILVPLVTEGETAVFDIWTP